MANKMSLQMGAKYLQRLGMCGRTMHQMQQSSAQDRIRLATWQNAERSTPINQKL
jgi:hypothetical protein